MMLPGLAFAPGWGAAQAQAPNSSGAAQDTPDKILLKDYRPRSIYKIPKTDIKKAKYPNYRRALPWGAAAGADRSVGQNHGYGGPGRDQRQFGAGPAGTCTERRGPTARPQAGDPRIDALWAKHSDWVYCREAGT